MARILACVDDKTRLPDGRTETGSTDNHGMTEWHYAESAESAENINLHILMD